MSNHEKGTWDFKSQIQALAKPLNETLGTEAGEEVLFHVSEVLTDFNRLQHEIFAIVGRASEESEPAEQSIAALVGWFETLRSGWSPHWQDHAGQALALLRPDASDDVDEEDE